MAIGRHLSPAEKFWIGLGVYVLVADVFLWRHHHDTMSIQFGKWLQTKNGRRVCLATTALLVGHLYMGIPLPLQSTMKKTLGGKK